MVGGLAGYVAPILGTDATAQRSRRGTAAMVHAAGEAQYAAHASMSLRASQQHAIRHARPDGRNGGRVTVSLVADDSRWSTVVSD